MTIKWIKYHLLELQERKRRGGNKKQEVKHKTRSSKVNEAEEVTWVEKQKRYRPVSLHSKRLETLVRHSQINKQAANTTQDEHDGHNDGWNCRESKERLEKMKRWVSVNRTNLSAGKTEQNGKITEIKLQAGCKKWKKN